MQCNERMAMEIFGLAHCKSVTLQEKLLIIGELADQPGAAFTDIVKKQNLKETKKQNLIRERQALDTESLLFSYQKETIGWITILDPAYPDPLRYIYDPPILLFYKGRPEILKENKISIVGSRKGSAYGRAALKKLLPPLTSTFTVVSGLARGIDSFAHEETMKLGGNTIAVIGTGINVHYPSENRSLQTQISQHHLILSEYPLNTPPMRHHFPMRNRIIAGLSLGTLVIEAEYKSGSLITAQLALTEGKEVFCVPGNITSPLSVGTNHLIQQGSHCVYDSSLILETLNRG